MDKWLELMDQFKQLITWSMAISSKLIRGAKVKLLTNHLLSQRILRQTKTTFSPSSLLEPSSMNYLRKQLKLKLKTKSRHLSRFKSPKNPSRRKKLLTLVHFTQQTPSRCTLTAWPNLLLPQKQVFPPQTPTRWTKTCGSQCLILGAKSTPTFSRLPMAMASTERKSVDSLKRCCRSTWMHSCSSWWKNTKKIWKKVARKNNWTQMRFASRLTTLFWIAMRSCSRARSISDSVGQLVSLCWPWAKNYSARM